MPAEYNTDSNLASCVFPAPHYPAEIAPDQYLEISNHGQHFSSSAVPLRVYSVASLQVRSHGLQLLHSLWRIPTAAVS